MKKKSIIIVSAIVAVVLIAVIALPLLVNVDTYRPMIEKQMSAALARPVKIGSLSLSLLAGGVTADNLSIGDDPAYSNEPFLQAKELKVGVDLMPLIFSRALHVNSLSLVEPQLQLLQSPSGKWNFSSLGTAPAQEAPRRGRSSSSAPASPPTSSSATTPNFSVAVLKVEKGRVTVGQTSQRSQHVYEDVNLEAKNIGYDAVMPFTLEAKTPGDGKMKVEGQAGPLDKRDTSATPLEATVNIEHMDVAASGFLPPSSGMAGILDNKSTIKSDGKNIKAEGTAKADKLRLVKSGGAARQPVTVDYATDYDVQRKTGTLTKGDIHTGNSTAKLTGNYDTRGDTPVVHMNLRGNSLPINDVEGLLPALGVTLPAGSRLQGGTVTANLNLAGPVDRLVTSGPIDVSNATLAGFNMASKLSAIAALAGVHGGPDTVIQSLSSSLRVAPEGIRADNLNVVVQNLGAVTGAGTIASNNALNFKMVAKLANGGGLLGGVSQIASLGQKAGAIPFLIQGTTSNPIFVPDVGAAIGNTVTAPAQGVEGLFGGIFGKKKNH